MGGWVRARERTRECRVRAPVPPCVRLWAPPLCLRKLGLGLGLGFGKGNNWVLDSDRLVEGAMCAAAPDSDCAAACF